MMNYLQYLNVVGPVAIVIIGLLVISEIIKAGKNVYEFVATNILKIQTKAAKKKERENQLADLILKNNVDLQNFIQDQGQFNTDMKNELINISNDVSENINSIREEISDMRRSQDELANTVTDMQLESMRETILDFASALSSPNGNVYTKEQFIYVKKIYNMYTKIIQEKNKTNDEVDLSMIIINDKYEYNVLHHTFVEDLVKNPDIKHDIDEEVEKSKNDKRSTRKAKGSNSKSSLESKED